MDRLIFEIHPSNSVATYAATGMPHSALQSDCFVSHGSILPIIFSDLELDDHRQGPINFWFEGVVRLAHSVRARQFKCVLCQGSGRRELRFRYFYHWLEHWKGTHEGFCPPENNEEVNVPPSPAPAPRRSPRRSLRRGRRPARNSPSVSGTSDDWLERNLVAGKFLFCCE